MNTSKRILLFNVIAVEDLGIAVFQLVVKLSIFIQFEIHLGSVFYEHCRSVPALSILPFFQLHRVSKKLCQCYFVNNSVKHWPNLITFGTQHRKEM